VRERHDPILVAGSGLSLLPLALVMTALIAVSGIVTAWRGGLICRRAAAQA
jgi:hypothetical protein